jgi:hypothetical protein
VSQSSSASVRYHSAHERCESDQPAEQQVIYKQRVRTSHSMSVCQLISATAQCGIKSAALKCEKTASQLGRQVNCCTPCSAVTGSSESKLKPGHNEQLL